jgi:predicted small integral membrane protein
MASNPPIKKSNDKSWMKYMGLGAQFFGSIIALTLTITPFEYNRSAT